MAEYNWGETGKAVPSPNRPVQPNWAERGGVLSFLASTLSKTQADYKQKADMEAQRQKDIADMARVKEQTAALKDVEYMKGMQDRLQAMQTYDPEYAPLAAELRRFAISKGLRPETVENPAIKAAEERFAKAEQGDFSDFADIDPKQVKAMFERRYDANTTDSMLIGFDKWKKKRHTSLGATPAPSAISSLAKTIVPEEVRQLGGPIRRAGEAYFGGARRFGETAQETMFPTIPGDITSLQPRPDVLEYMNRYYGGGKSKADVLADMMRNRQNPNVVLPPPQQ